jgi:sterol desaturase/sphingolipid hydroxylase (fatty acid hydroxylase superfamily)
LRLFAARADAVRRTQNYGKQTRLWDKIFGTSRSRIESFEENIDFVNVARTC